MRELGPPATEIDFDDFMATYSDTAKAKFGVISEDNRDLFWAPEECSLFHCVVKDLRMTQGIVNTFKSVFSQLDKLSRQDGRVAQVLKLQRKQRRIFFLVAKEKPYQKLTYRTLWEDLWTLRERLPCFEHLKIDPS